MTILNGRIKLNRIACTENYMGDWKQEHTVTLEQGKLGIILRIDGTQGGWYMSDLLGLGTDPWNREPVGKKIMIDSGRGIYCVNIQEVVKHALRAVVGCA